MGKRKQIKEKENEENEQHDSDDNTPIVKNKSSKTSSTSSKKSNTTSSKTSSTSSKKSNNVAYVDADDEEDDEDEEDEEENLVEEEVEASVTKKNAMKKLPPNTTILSVWINANKISVNGNEVLTFSPSKAASNVTRPSNLDGDLWKELCIIYDWPPGFDKIFERLENIAKHSDWDLGKVFSMFVKTGATIDKYTDDAILNNKKNPKKGSKQKVEMVHILKEWDVARYLLWINQEQGKPIHDLIIVLAKHDVEIVNPAALAIKGSKANNNKLVNMIKQALSALCSYLFNYWRFGQATKTSNDIFKAVKSIGTDSTSGKKAALEEFKKMLAVFEAELIADQSIDIDNLSVQLCVDHLMEKLGNRNDDFFEAYEYWEPRVPSTSDEIIDLATA